MMILLTPFLYNKGYSLTSFDDISRRVISYDLIFKPLHQLGSEFYHWFSVSLRHFVVYAYINKIRVI